MAPERQRAKPRRWTRLRVCRWAVIFLIVLFVGGVGSVELTSWSGFCNSCHIMNSFYDSWEAGVHHEVGCVECHIAPGTTNFVSAKLNGLGQVVDDWLNRTSPKPSAAVSDFACTREGCHDMTQVGVVASEELPYFFNHDMHRGLEYKGIGVHCTTCHSHIKGDRHFQVNTNVCITCHLAGPQIVQQPVRVATVAHRPDASRIQGDVESGLARALAGDRHEKVAPTGCDACHDPPAEPMQYQGLIVDHEEFLSHGATCTGCHRGVTDRPRPVGDAQCLACHIFGREQVTSAEEMHRIHTHGEHKIECFNCHGVTRHGRDAQSMSLSQFDCRNCHAAQHQVQRGTYMQADEAAKAEPVEDEPLAVSPMFLAHVDCTRCHIEPRPVSVNASSGATVAVAVPSACDNCHRPGLGERMIPMWQRDTRQMYDAVLALLPTPEAPWAGDRPNAQALIDEAWSLLELVRIDGSWGVHNPRFTQDLIGRAREKLLRARAICEVAPGETP